MEPKILSVSGAKWHLMTEIINLTLDVWDDLSKGFGSISIIWYILYLSLSPTIIGWGRNP